MKIKEIFLNIIFLIINSIRPFIGPPNTCIYQTTCTVYAKRALQNKPLYLAIPLIVLRLLSCNPITAIYWKLKNKKY